MSEIIDNRARRIGTMKEIIGHLHAGQAPEEVKQRLKTLVRETDSDEIIAMEQELIAGGMPVEEIQSMCDLHSQVTREILVPLPARALAPGHPVDTFRRENEALGKVAGEMRTAAAGILALREDEDAAALVLQLRQGLNDLMDVDKHYQRKEHAVFSHLERHGINGPSKVMWGKDDEVRGLLKDLARALRQAGSTREWKSVAGSAVPRALGALEEMIYKEENILLPMCLEKFTAEEWAEIWAVSPKYGWCLVEPGEGYRPAAAAEATGLSAGEVMLPTGNLSLDQLRLIFSTLPVDLTFVDDDDRVRFFSEGPNRVFARSRAIIGRKVQNCHPPRSVHIVDRILADFREGRESVAEFWIEFQKSFVHIRYFAVRGPEGRYEGTLEVTQDVTAIRQLEGERRLL